MQKIFKFLVYTTCLLAQIFVLAGCGGGSSSSNGSTSGTTNTPDNAVTVKMTTPANGATNVSTKTDIVLVFSEPVKNVSNTSVTLHTGSPTGSPVGLLQPQPQTDNVTYDFKLPEDSVLNSNTVYYVVVNNSIVSVQTGASLEATNFNFKTSNVPAPTVTITPANGVTNQPLKPAIKLGFSTAVANVNTTTVSLHIGSANGESVALNNLVKDPNSNNYVTTPKVNLDPNKQYFIVLTNGITSVSDNTPLVPTTSSFTTGNFPTPVIQSTTPANGETNVSPNTNITIKFNEAVNNVTESTVTLHLDSPTSESTVDIGSIIAGASNSYVITTAKGLPINRTIYVVLSSGITSVNGNVPLAPTNFSFTTGKISVPLVSMVNPINDGVNVSTNTIIKLVFSEAVNGVDTSTVMLLESDPVSGTIVATTAIVAGSGNSYTFSSTAELKPFTKYYVVINSGITAVADGEQLAPTNFNFMTGKSNSAPTVTMVSPDNNSTIESLNPNIQLQFSQAVNGVSTSTVTLRDSNGNIVATTNPTAGSNHTYSFSPVKSLNPATQYYVEIESGITSVSNGLPLAITNFSFDTDVTATVTMLSPTNNSNVTSTFPTIQLQFSESVNGVSNSTVTLRESSPTGSIVNTTTIKAESNNIFVFTPTTQLHRGYTYYVVLESGITSASNNFPVAPTNFNFAVESTPGSSAFAYITSDSGISLCNVNNETGELENCGLIESSVGAYSVSIDTSNSLAYISNKNGGSVTACKINTTTGQFNTCNSVGGFNQPTYVSFSPDGQNAYIANHGGNSVLVCSLDESNSTPINCKSTGTGFSNPQQVLIDPTNSFAYVTNTKSQVVTLCTVESTGILDNCNTSGSGFVAPMGMIFSNNNASLFTTSEDAISACTMDRTTGALSECQDAIIGFTRLSGITSYKNNVYVSDAGNGAISLCKEDLNGNLVSPCLFTAKNMVHTSGIAIFAAN